jgi:hypothetical protein
VSNRERQHHEEMQHRIANVLASTESSSSGTDTARRTDLGRVYEAEVYESVAHRLTTDVELVGEVLDDVVDTP